MKSVYNIGSDGGNASFKLTFEDGMKFIYPNIVVPRTLHYQKYSGNGTPSPNKLHVEVTLNRMNAKPDVTEILFGELAKDYVNAASGNRANMNKSNDLKLVKGKLTSIAYSIFLNQYRRGNDLTKEKDNRVSFNINIGTGLPYEEAIKPGACDKYRENLEGTHLIKFKNPDFNGLAIELVCQKALTHYVEGEVIVDLVLDPSISGEMDYNELVGSIFVMVDGGAYTLDVTGTEFTKSHDFDMMTGKTEEIIAPETKEQYSFGLARGIGHVFKEIIDDVAAVHVDKIERDLDRKDIEDAIENIIDGKRGWIMPERIYIGELVSNRVSVYAEEVARKFIAHYNDANAKSKIRKVYLAGGASKIDEFVNTFVKVLQEENYNPDIIIRLATKPDPIHANADGYLANLLLDLEDIKEQEAGVLADA